MNQNYIDTVRLLLAIAPAVFASGRFAMKGGAALSWCGAIPLGS